MYFQTFNATEAASQAYNCKNRDSARNLGSDTFAKLCNIINQWLDENDLSEPALKTKLVELVNAKEVKVFQHQGEIIESDELTAWGPRSKGLELAMRSKGMLIDKVEHSGTIKTIHDIDETEKKAAKAAIETYLKVSRNGASGKKKG